MSKLAETAIRTTGSGPGTTTILSDTGILSQGLLAWRPKRLEVFDGPKTPYIEEPSRYESDTTASLSTSTTLMWRYPVSTIC
jgi:hypothetical protein